MDPRKTKYFTYIKPILRNKAARTYGPVMFSLVTIAIFSVFAVKPTVETIISLQKSISEQNELLDKVTTKADNLVLGRRNYQNIDSEVRIKLESLIPNSLFLPTIINNLNALAISNQASISAIQFQPSVLEPTPESLNKNAGLKEITFIINTQGSYNSLVNFLTNLSNERLIEVQSIIFNKTEENPLSMTINAKAYYLKN